MGNRIGADMDVGDRLGRATLVVCCLAALLASGCSNTADTDAKVDTSSSTASLSSHDDLRVVDRLPPPANTNNGTEILIAENDLIEVDVFQVDELDKEVRVEPNGKISLPLIGGVVAAGKTVSQLETDIERRYGVNYLQNPEVSVFMKESAGQQITLDGEFAKPGIYASNSNTTLLQATALAGGLSRLADEKKLYVFRQIGERKYVANYSIKDIREGRKSDPNIYGGDIVIAFQSGSKVAAQNLKEALGIAVSATRLATPL